MAPSEGEHRKRAKKVLSAFRIADGVYLLGSMERGVTVYGQQVRAHNLVWALWEIEHRRNVRQRPRRIAIVGGGIGGLTAAACTRVMFPAASITIFERNSDLAALQQGSDTRWLHPRIYNWPDYGSRAPSASLPVLNWSEGRASDVAHQILSAFGNYVGKNMRINVGVEHLRIDAADRAIEWVGRRGKLDGQFVLAGEATGTTEAFDYIILALGFGLETPIPEFPTASYWRNETLSQPHLGGVIKPFVVSGYGDGAIIDLCRLSIERFRQDRILYDLFGDKIEEAEASLRSVKEDARNTGNAFHVFEGIKKDLLLAPRKELIKRIRKDTKVVMHLSGKNANTSLANAFGETSSFANRMMLYLLYQCGAFVPRFGRLDSVAIEYGVSERQVVCRYGPATAEHVLAVFTDRNEVVAEMDRIRNSQAQTTERRWRLGAIPNLERREG